MNVLIRSLMLMLLLPFMASVELHAFEFDKNYLYYRDAHVPPFQKSREFFDMPDRPGFFEVTMVSDTAGPLTFRIVRVRDEVEQTLAQKRSYHVGSHEFQAHFDNVEGSDDLIVEIANSNPAAVAKVAVFVVELPKH